MPPRNEKPGVVSQPGTLREFEFHECTDFQECVKRRPPSFCASWRRAWLGGRIAAPVATASALASQSRAPSALKHRAEGPLIRACRGLHAGRLHSFQCFGNMARLDKGDGGGCMNLTRHRVCDGAPEPTPARAKRAWLDVVASRLNLSDTPHPGRRGSRGWSTAPSRARCRLQGR